MDILCVKGPSGALLPLDDEQRELVERFKSGAVLRVRVVQVRNSRFFRKWWVLAKYAFDLFVERTPRLEYRGQAVLPRFDRFRKDLTILAGYYHPVFNALGDLRLEADSLAWSSMDEETFEQLYSATIDAVLRKVIDDPTLTEEALRRHVDRVLSFA